MYHGYSPSMASIPLEVAGISFQYFSDVARSISESGAALLPVVGLLAIVFCLWELGVFYGFIFFVWCQILSEGPRDVNLRELALEL